MRYLRRLNKPLPINNQFLPLETVIDFEYPVAGNRCWGIFSDPDHPGEFVFYTMRVDRIWDGSFSFGDWLMK